MNKIADKKQIFLLMGLLIFTILFVSEARGGTSTTSTPQSDGDNMTRRAKYPFTPNRSKEVYIGAIWQVTINNKLDKDITVGGFKDTPLGYAKCWDTSSEESGISQSIGGNPLGALPEMVNDVPRIKNDFYDYTKILPNTQHIFTTAEISGHDGDSCTNLDGGIKFMEFYINKDKNERMSLNNHMNFTDYLNNRYVRITGDQEKYRIISSQDYKDGSHYGGQMNVVITYSNQGPKLDMMEFVPPEKGTPSDEKVQRLNFDSNSK